jgi:hypothetical protein
VLPVADAGAIFLKLNLAFEVSGHLIEFADNPLQIINLSGLLFYFTTLQPYGCVTWLHRSIPQTHSNPSPQGTQEACQIQDKALLPWQP